jgi:hypothetical protein
MSSKFVILEIIAVCSENHMKPINTLLKILLIVKVGGT